MSIFALPIDARRSTNRTRKIGLRKVIVEHPHMPALTVGRSCRHCSRRATVIWQFVEGSQSGVGAPTRLAENAWFFGFAGLESSTKSSFRVSIVAYVEPSPH